MLQRDHERFIDHIFEDVKKDEDGLKYAQEVLNYVEKFRSNISSKLVNKRFFKR